MSNVVSLGYLGSVTPNLAVFGFLGANVPPPVPPVATNTPGPSDGRRDKGAYWDDYAIRFLLLTQ